MKKRKLKKFVLPCMYIIIMCSLFIGIGSFTKSIMSKSKDYDFSVNSLKNITTPVVTTDVEESVIEPVTKESASIVINYYDKDSTEEEQQNSIIFYENTYMKNYGILYGSEQSFDVMAVLDGTIKNITKDEILGNVVEIIHSNDTRTIYYCLGDVYFKNGDTVKQGDVIGVSGSSKLDTGKDNNMLFEVYHKGNIMNPLDFYKMNINEI